MFMAAFAIARFARANISAVRTLFNVSIRRIGAGLE